jgi:nucleotide-binding universal stress UspA family protein
MLKTILIALDGSDFAARAVPVAADLAHRAGAGTRALAIAKNRAELAWLHDHVSAATERYRLDASIEFLVNPDPATLLLERTLDDGTALCLATHDRLKPVAALIHSVGAAVIDHATRPVVAVGPRASVSSFGQDVVVALDGVDDAGPLLAVAAAWAIQLQTRLRIVTVYEPVLPDVRQSQHYTRRHGPPSDPDVYLGTMAERARDLGLVDVETVAVADPVGVTPGIEAHLAERAALLLVLGGGRRHRLHGHPGVVHGVLASITSPVLVVNRNE